jgi:hypothetical protein
MLAAFLARDALYDGVFVTGVSRSSGHPARRPLPPPVTCR